MFHNPKLIKSRKIGMSPAEIDRIYLFVLYIAFNRVKYFSSGGKGTRFHTYV